MVQRYGVGLFNINIYVVLEIILEKKGNKSEYNIIQIIFKCCESNMYLILLLPNIKRTYDQIDQINQINQIEK